jgi:hypothetical protein
LDDEDDGDEASEIGRLVDSTKLNAAANSGDDTAEMPPIKKTADDDDAQAPLGRPKKAVDWKQTTAMMRAKLKKLEEELDGRGSKQREVEVGHGRQMEEESYLGRSGVDESAAEDEVLRDWSAVSQAPKIDEANAASENELTSRSSPSSLPLSSRHARRKRAAKESSQAERSLLKGGHNRSGQRPAHGTLESMDHMQRTSSNGGRQPRRAPRPVAAKKEEDEEDEDEEEGKLPAPAPNDDAMVTDPSVVGDWGAAAREEQENDGDAGSSGGKHHSKKSAKDLKKAISQSWSVAKREEKAKERRERRAKERKDSRARGPSDDANNAGSEESEGQDRRDHSPQSEHNTTPREAANEASSREDDEVAKMTAELQPYLDRAEKPGVNPRKEVVPLLRKVSRNLRLDTHQCTSTHTYIALLCTPLRYGRLPQLYTQDIPLLSFFHSSLFTSCAA